LSLSDSSDDVYLSSKTALPAASEQLVKVYGRVCGELRPEHRILDWGCRHGVFSFLARSDLGSEVDLHGCDICSPDEYEAHHRSVGLQYKQIAHPSSLEYADNTFDCVLAGGTLEHVPNDVASLNELWRVLKPYGALIITHLPNSGSWSELVSRLFFPIQAHKRLYSLAQTRQQLVHQGFLTEQCGYHHLAPSSLPPSLLNKPLLAQGIHYLQVLNMFENFWPIRKLSAACWIVARKYPGF
jgi:SAM-dependent methyltransferase